MGLDLADITFRMEKAFDVDISQDDLEAIARDQDIVVGDLYELVLRKLHLRDVGRYDIRLNRALWIELQAVIHSVTETPLDRIELGTPLETLFPRETRRTTWDALREASPDRIRKLDYPRIVRMVGFPLAAGTAFVELFQIWQVPGVKWLWPLLGFLGIWMLVETYAKVMWVLAPLRSRFPSGMITVKDLCRIVLATNYRDICRRAEIPHDERGLAVWQQLTCSWDCIHKPVKQAETYSIRRPERVIMSFLWFCNER